MTIRVPPSKVGLFITLEGIEGAGKSSAMKTVCNFLVENSHQVVTTREPGGTPLGESVRGLLLDGGGDGMDALTELLLMFAARREHWVKVIEPALTAGKTVISDRFTDSSYAYQGGGRGLDPAIIEGLESVTLADHVPDCTLVIDVPVTTGLARAARNGTPDRFESEQQAFFERARHVFLERAARFSHCHVVDGSQSEDSVSSDIVDCLSELLR